MTSSAHLGGGYATAQPDPQPTATAVLAAAQAGSQQARLIIVAGPPGVGKSAVAAQLSQLLPETIYIDKDLTAGGFILEAATLRGETPARAYAAPHYWQKLRPLEYAGPTALACSNLLGRRQVLLVGGWGPELTLDALWDDLRQRIAPAQLCVLHLDAPALETWRSRLAARGSRCDSPYFEQLAKHTGALPVWQGATRLATDAPLRAVVQHALCALKSPVYS
ncbi:MAG: energy-coupling factor transporter ATP-binding protein EcfA2 [Candidatus Latescibacterota bacterium]|jgi:hypothetical protein